MGSVARRSGLALMLFAGVVLKAQPGPPSTPNSQGGREPYLFRLTTREVLLDVVATDRRDHPIRDLSQQEMQVFEISGRDHKTPVNIASFRLIDASVEHPPVAPQSGGFRVSLGGTCAARATLHYEISFHPDEQGWLSGYHDIEVRTTRSGVKLAYHSRYYVGAREAQQKLLTSADDAVALQQAACYHPDVPPSIGLSARRIATGLGDFLRFFVTVDAQSLAFISVSADSRRVQLDYGACAFDARGKPLRYFTSVADRMLTSSEYAQAVVHGFPNLLEFPRIDGAALMRVVVRDRTTGNIGTIRLSDLAAEASSQLAGTDPDEVVKRIALQQMDAHASYSPSDPGPYGHEEGPFYIQPPPGPIGSFGSIVSQPNTFCGDVYDLPKGTVRLPNFWNLSSIGSLYTPELDVPHQVFENTGGIPGITRSTACIGIDYHATFWVSAPGEYAFRLLVDDGANLYIDDKKVIDIDGVNSGRMASGKIELSPGAHDMHIPYIQGPPNAVGLVLAVRAPGQRDFQIFDLRVFSPTGKNDR
jgi:hypothetical protein